MATINVDENGNPIDPSSGEWELVDSFSAPEEALTAGQRPAPEPQSYLGSLIPDPLEAAGAGFMRGLGGIIKSLEPHLPQVQGLGQLTGGLLPSQSGSGGEDLIQGAQRSLEQTRLRQPENSWAETAVDVGGGLGTAAPALLSVPFTEGATIPTLLTGVMSAGQSYADTESLPAALATGAVDALANLIPIQKFSKPGASFLNRAMTSGLVNAVINPLQTIADLGIFQRATGQEIPEETINKQLKTSFLTGQAFSLFGAAAASRRAPKELREAMADTALSDAMDNQTAADALIPPEVQTQPEAAPLTPRSGAEEMLALPMPDQEVIDAGQGFSLGKVTEGTAPPPIEALAEGRVVKGQGVTKQASPETKAKLEAFANKVKTQAEVDAVQDNLKKEQLKQTPAVDADTEMATLFNDRRQRRLISEGGHGDIFLDAAQALKARVQRFFKAADEAHTEEGQAGFVKAVEDITGKPFALKPGEGTVTEVVEPRGEQYLRGKVQKLGGIIPLGKEGTTVPLASTVRKYVQVPLAVAKAEPELRPLIDGVQKILVKGVNKSQYELKEIAQDFYNVPAKEKPLLHRIIWQADEKGAGWSPSDQKLKALGLSEAGIKGFWAARRVLDESWNRIEQALIKRGHDPADVSEWIRQKRVENYFPRARNGDFYVSATDHAGNPLVSYHVNRAEAQAAAQQYHKDGFKEIKFGRNEEPRHDAYADLPPDLRRQMGLLDDEGAATDYSRGGPIKGFKGRFAKRKGIPGYKLDAEKALTDYISGVSRFAGNEEFIPIANQVLKRLEGKPQALTYAQGYLKEVMTPSAQFSKLRALQSAWYMAGSTANAAQNVLSSLTNTLPYATSELGLKRAPRAARLWIGAQKDAMSYWATPSRFAKRYPDLAKALAEERKSGTFGSFAMDELQSRKGKKFDDTMQKLMILQRATDAFTKSHAYITGWRVGESKMKGASPAQLADYAEQFHNTTMFLGSKANKPPIARGWGSVPFLFKQWPWEQFNFITSHGGTNLGLSLAALWFMAGARGFPGMRDALRAGKGLGYDPEAALDELVGPTVSTAITKGPFRKLTSFIPGLPEGVDIGGIVSSSVFPEGGKDIYGTAGRLLFGPTGDMLSRAYRSGELYSTYNNPYMAVENMAPRAIRNAMSGARGQLQPEGLLTPQNQLLFKPTVTESIAQALGFPSARLTDIYQNRQQVNSLLESDANNIYGRLADAIAENDNARIDKILNEAMDKEIDLGQGKRSIGMNMLQRTEPDLVDLLKAPKNKRAKLLELQERQKRK